MGAPKSAPTPIITRRVPQSAVRSSDQADQRAQRDENHEDEFSHFCLLDSA
jgi:hypothetical protein